VVEDLQVFGVESLSDVVMFLRGEKILEPVQPISGWSREVAGDQDLDFGEVKGQAHVKRAIEVAAAGGHNALTFGPISPNNFELRFLSEIFGIVLDPTAFFSDALRAALPRANYRPLRGTQNSP
jgi:hypothetical protein